MATKATAQQKGKPVCIAIPFDKAASGTGNLELSAMGQWVPASATASHCPRFRPAGLR
jgi:hypothetical protein